MGVKAIIVEFEVEKMTNTVILSLVFSFIGGTIVAITNLYLMRRWLVNSAKQPDSWLSTKSGAKVTVEYQIYIEDLGWTINWLKNGEIAGTTGQYKRIKAIRIGLVGSIPNEMCVRYKFFNLDNGWSDWFSDNEVAGAVARRSQMEGIRIKLENAPPEYEILYQAHIANYGWMMNWVQDGAIAGSLQEDNQIEAIRIRLNTPSDTNTNLYASNLSNNMV